MDIQSKANDTTRIAGRLAIERCQQHLAHLHTLLHLCGYRAIGIDDNVAEGVRIIMAGLQLDLSYSASMLQISE